MPKRKVDKSVFDLAIDRMVEVYDQGHRVVYSMSGGKDSTCCMEIGLIAAELTGNLPIDVVTRDEEIMFPGTFEYCERVAERDEVNFHWLIANQPIINIFNRENPYFWTFDPLLPKDEWVREPPPYAIIINDKYIEAITSPERFPPNEGKELFAVVGIRTDESNIRTMAIASSRGHLTKPNFIGTRRVRPIYDWKDGDVWLAIQQNKWDFNTAYNVMCRAGIPRKNIRIAPPTMATASVDSLSMAQRAWPRWFDRVCNRLHGVRTAAMFGKRAVLPLRRSGESWEDCFMRTCVNEAPEWISKRAAFVMERQLAYHARHSSDPFPQNEACSRCAKPTSWKNMSYMLYMGDPFGMKVQHLNRKSGEMVLQGAIPPEYFRKGAGTWGEGSPSF